MRKFLALMLSCILSAGAVSMVANAARFTDVPADDQALADAVDLLANVGITSGTTETTFGTSEGVTRQQMATFIYRLMKAGKSVEGKEGDNTTSFKDLDDPYYYFMVSWANEMGIIKGKSETSFDPKGGIILQDAYTMLVRALGYEKDKTLAYPFDYIGIAEKIGLDNGLPSNVNYDTALTRGNTAVLLYNAFYADMAHGTTFYKTEYDFVPHPTTGVEDVVETGTKQHTIYDTVAEKIFGLKKTVQRVVATPNYSLDNNKTTKADTDGYETLTVECLNKEYIGTDTGLFDEIAFDSLNLSGKADDYFLMDLAIYYKKNSNNELEIISASSLGTYKKQLPGSKVKFEQDSKYTYQGDGGYTAASGKVTIDGQVSYLFNAPWSYSKPMDLSKKDDECITLVWLAGTDRDPESEEYVIDFNFKSHKDVLGQGAEAYRGKTGAYYDKTKPKVNGSHPPVGKLMEEMDLRGQGGLYSPAAMAGLMQINYTSSNFEADAWDSNSDGKYDYLWLKPYTIGKASAKETLMDMHATKDPYDAISCVYDKNNMPTIYTDGAVIEGTSFKDGQFITAYINGPANYIKVSTAKDIEYETVKCTGDKGSDSRYVYFDGSYKDIADGRKYVGTPGFDGKRGNAFGVGGSPLAYWGPSNRGNIKAGNTYDVLWVGSAIFHVKDGENSLEIGGNYAMIFPNASEGSAITTSVGIVDDGNLTKSADILEVLIDGELVKVAVRPQTNKNLTEIDVRPETRYNKEADVYDFKPYVGKLLTYTVNENDEYTFKIVPLDKNNDPKVLQTDDVNAYYTYEPETLEWDSAAFVKSTGNRYRFLVPGKDVVSNIHPAGVKYLTFVENTKVVIKTADEDGEPVFTIYDYENLPNFSNKDDFKNIRYVVKNDPKSATTEELLYLYAEATDGKTGIKNASTLDYRFVMSYKTVGTADGKVIYYDVYNPFKGIIEEEYEAITDSETAVCDKFGIYTISNGYIDDENKLGSINTIGKMATSVTDKDVKNLGLVEINEYDEENGFLTVGGENLTFIVDEDTKITFLDLDNNEITTKSADILSSKAKAYRCDDNTKVPLLAFVASSEIKKENDFEHAEVICVVRYNALAKNYVTNE